MYRATPSSPRRRSPTSSRPTGSRPTRAGSWRATLDPAQFASIARLPGVDVLRGQLVGLTASPLTGVVRTLNQLIQGLASQLGQVAEQGLVSGEAPAAEAPAEEPATEEPAAEEPEPTPADPEAEAPAAEADADETTSETEADETPEDGEDAADGEKE
jgi:hypothetical protein